MEGVLSALLFSASFWIAPIGFLLCLLSPLPLATAAWRGRVFGAGIAIATGAATVVLAGGLGSTGVYVFYFAVGGALIGLTLRRGSRPESVVAAFATASLAAFWVTLGFQAVQTGTMPTTYLAESVRQSAEHMKELLLQANAAPEVVSAVQEWAERFSRGFAGSMAALSILVGWANGVGLRRLLRNRGVELPSWNTWRARESWIWILIGSGLVAILGSGGWATLALNIFIPALAVYFLQGLAVVQHLFETKAFPRALRVVTYVLLFFQLPVMLLVAGLGAFDLWLDFRSRWSPPATGA